MMPEDVRKAVEWLDEKDRKFTGPMHIPLAKYKAAWRKARAHHATLADMAKRLEAAERDSKRLRNAKTATVEFDETIDGEHVGVIPFPHSAVGRKYKLVRIDATQEGEG